jgi:AcrR family transcriptional regulator
VTTSEAHPVSGRRARGSYSKGRAKRAEILREAVLVFAGSGYRGGSLKEIADRVGLSQAGLLHHFSSKEQLLAEVIAERDAEDIARLARDEQTVSGWAALNQMVALVRHNATVPGLVQLYATLSGEAVAEDHPAHPQFVDRYRRVREHLRVALVQAQAEGDVATDVDAAAAAAGLVALMDGLQTQWLLEPAAVDMAAAFEAALLRLRP